MAADLIIAVSVGVAVLALAFAFALGRVARHADRQMQRHAKWARAHGTIAREMPSAMPSPRTNTGAMRLPVSVSLPTPSRSAEDAKPPARFAGFDLGAMASLRATRVGTPTGMTAWVAGRTRRRRAS